MLVRVYIMISSDVKASTDDTSFVIISLMAASNFANAASNFANAASFFFFALLFFFRDQC